MSLALALALTLTLALALSLALTLALALALTGVRFAAFLSLRFGAGFALSLNPNLKERNFALMTSPNVYIRSRRLVQQLAPLVVALRKHDRSLSDQLRRAAQSVVLNIAEARGNDAGNARARFATACGSAKETRAALHIAGDWGYLPKADVTALDAELDRICAITWTLSQR